MLDLTTIMRYSGLPNNAGLEMCAAAKKRAESSVIILVQLENGTRVTGDFVPSGELNNVVLQSIIIEMCFLDSMWHVVSTVCGDELAAMDSPVIIFTRTEVCGEEKLKATTLRSLGLIGGRAMFRYKIYRYPA